MEIILSVREDPAVRLWLWVYESLSLWLWLYLARWASSPSSRSSSLNYLPALSLILHRCAGVAFSVQRTKYRVQCTKYSVVQRTVYQVQRTVYQVQRTPYSVPSTAYDCTKYSVQCTKYLLQRTKYSVQCTKYSVQCTNYSVQCTKYSVHCAVQCECAMCHHPSLHGQDNRALPAAFISVQMSIIWGRNVRSVRAHIVVFRVERTVNCNWKVTVSVVWREEGYTVKYTGYFFYWSFLKS